MIEHRLIEGLMEAIAPIIKGEIQPLRERIAALEAIGPIEVKAGKDGERGADGANGADGAPGKDAPAPTVEQLASAINAINEFPALVTDAVTSYLAANPPPAGKDGRDGIDGKDGAPGAAGPQGDKGEARDGRDGLPGVPGLPGDKGADGKDGIGIDDYEVVLEDDGRFEVRRWKRGDDVVKEIRIKHAWPLYREVWQPAKGYDKGDIVTCSNESWIAVADNSDKPPSAAWRLMARKGRDGRDGQLRALQDACPVKLR